MEAKMNKKELLLAAFAPANCGVFTPVQVQKMIFIIDRQLSLIDDGPKFEFRPYYYGPFDKSVYEELESLATNDLVLISTNGTWNNYRLTEKGQKQGEKILRTLKPNIQEYFSKVSEFVHTLSFQQLVSSIYKAYPEMRVNSIFQE
jgi:uncharacterized protein YwgA